MVASLLIFFILAAVVLAIDLVTKYFLYGGAGFTIIPGLLSVYPVRNFGAAFGLPLPLWFLIGVTFVILALGGAFYFKFKTGRKNKLFNIAFGFILGGALGNLADRIFLGYVRDFLQFDFLPGFPVMNFADWFLNVGMALLIIYIIFVYKGKGRGTVKG